MPAWVYVDEDGDPVPGSRLTWRDCAYQVFKLLGNVAESVADYLIGMRSLVAADANHHIEKRAFLDEAREDIESLDSIDEESTQE